MNTLKKFSFLYIILAAVFLLSACIPTGAADAGTTIDATQAAEMIEEAVAQALDAQATQIAESVPQATATVAPTNTAIPAPATITPAPTITPLVLAPTASSSGGSGGTTVKTYALACDEGVSSSKSPYDLTDFSAGDTFDIRFMIVNTGTDTWAAGYDLTYSGGPDMTNGSFTTLELPEMKPGASFTVGPYDAWAPNEKGRQVMQFNLQGGFCYPYIAINVK